jgi:HAD superfamily hydrolase (TIGR01450 family)
MERSLKAEYTGLDREQARRLLDTAERILCDIDGCLISGDRPLQGAAAFVARYRDRLVLLSNNSTDTAVTMAARLKDCGLAVPSERIVLAGQAAVAFLRDGPLRARRIFLLANIRIRGAAERSGLTHCAETAEAVLVCRDTELTLDRLERAVRLLARGVPMVVANPDLTHPGREGAFIETGAIAALLRACVEPDRVFAVGKPEPGLFLSALGDVRPDQAVMIGDGAETDAAGARRLEMPCILTRCPTSPGRLGLDDLF